jgi:excisionase family DNA binding protein
MSTNLTIRKAAEYLGYKVKTLQKWDRDGKLVAGRTKTGRRVYTEEQLEEFLGITAEQKDHLPIEKEALVQELSSLSSRISSVLHDLNGYVRRLRVILKIDINS